VAYNLGVDLGTTFVAAAVAYPAQVEMFTLGDRSVVVPSVVYLRDDGVLVSGDAAGRRAVSNPDRVGREFKRRLGDPTPVMLGGNPHTVTALLGALLGDVLTKVSETEGDSPGRVVLTHPANWGPFRRALFEEVPGLAGLTDVSLVTEPEAAAAHYAGSRQLDDGEVVAVYDLGGGTFDATVLRKRADGVEILGTPEGIERLGGVDFDEAILAHVNVAAGGALSELDLSDPKTTIALARLRQDCVLAKEALSVDTEVVLPVFLPGRHFDVSITRTEFENLIRAQIESTIGALSRTLRSAQVTPEQLSAVLLVGGSSRIPLIAEMVSTELDRPTVVDTHPKYAVALGAATLAGSPSAAPAAGAAGGERRGKRRLRGKAAAAAAEPAVAAGARGLLGGRAQPAASPAPAGPNGAAAKASPNAPAAKATPQATPTPQTAPKPQAAPTPPVAPQPRAARGPQAPAPQAKAGPAPQAAAPKAAAPNGAQARNAVPSPAPPKSPAPPNGSGPNPAAVDPLARTTRMTAAPPGTANGRRAPGGAPGQTAPNQGGPGQTAPNQGGPGQGAPRPTAPGQGGARSRPDQRSGGGPPPLKPPPGRPVRTGHTPDPGGWKPPPDRRRRTLLVVLGVLAAVAVVFGSAYLFHSLRSGNQAAGAGKAAVSNPAAVAPPLPSTGAPTVPIPSLGTAIPIGRTPDFVAVTPNGRLAYVANGDAKTVTVLDTSVNRIIATIPVPAGPPQFLTFAPDGRRIYISIFDDARTIAVVAVLDTTTNQIVATIPVRTRPFRAAVTADGKLLYVPNHDSGTVSVIDTQTLKLLREIQVPPNPHWIAFSRDGTRAYTADHESNVIGVLDVASSKVIASIPVGKSPHALAVHPTRPLLANVNYDGNTVTMIDTNTDQVTATIPVGKQPQSIQWTADGRFAYVVNNGDNTVSVIDGTTNQVTATIPTGPSPTNVALLPNDRLAYVTNLGDGTLTVLNPGG
jgi:YVTN family beta-propeller protein